MSNCGCNKTPCGCKSTGTAITIRSSCGCGGNGCTACEPRTYIRPRFFAGQLLTEDDLALLGDYVVAKNRLHNRALFGPGVVCGLDVHCDPCGGGNVIVSPGYAINCCGDDIVVPCPESVDILALIKDLQASMLGATCADPCELPTPQQPGRVPNPKAPIKRYYLYIRYVEDLTDPVSPYATDETCAGLACEPTRVREGHRYELRCSNDNPHFPGLGETFLHCIRDIAQVKRLAADATILNRIAARVGSAQRSLAQTPSPVFVAADVAPLRTATTDLHDATAALRTTPVEAERVRSAVEALRVAGSLFGRLVMTPPRQRPDVDEETKKRAQKELSAAFEVLPPAIKSAGFSELETVEANATLELAHAFPTLGEPPPTITYSQKLWAYGAPLTDALYAATRDGQTSINAYVRPVLQSSARPNDCQLLAQLEGVRPIAAGTVTEPNATSLATNGVSTTQVLGRLLYECLCAALNPPCQQCDDPAVLLAEICVQDCVVIDICEMVRRFVITWPNVRYWTDIPNFQYNINALGQLFERLCCEQRGACQPPRDEPGGPVILRMPQLALSRTVPADQPLGQLSELLPMIEPLATATAVVPGGRATGIDPALEQTIEARVKDAVTAALASTERELASLREKVARLSTRGPA